VKLNFRGITFDCAADLGLGLDGVVAEHAPSRPERLRHIAFRAAGGQRRLGRDECHEEHEGGGRSEPGIGARPPSARALQWLGPFAAMKFALNV
jgi:hypothetical protein